MAIRATRRRDNKQGATAHPHLHFGRFAIGLAAPEFSRLPRSFSRRRATFNTPIRTGGLIVAVLLLALFPSLTTAYYVGVASVMLLAVPGVAALSALQGVAGQVSVANAALMSIGAFMAAFLLREYAGLPFPIILVLAGAAAGLVGVLIGIPAVRAQGLYLLMATLALQFIVAYLTEQYQNKTVGADGFIFPNPKIGAFAINSIDRWYYLLLVLAVLAMVVFKNWLSSRVGRSWRVIRHGGETASVLGVNVVRTKVAVFVVTSVIIGVQGAVFAYYTFVVQSSEFSFAVAIQYVAMVIIGGEGSVLGVAFGVVFVEGMPYLLQKLFVNAPAWLPAHAALQEHIFDVQNLVYGAAIMFFITRAPGGLVELWERAVQRLRLWPFRQELTLEHARLERARSWGERERGIIRLKPEGAGERPEGQSSKDAGTEARESPLLELHDLEVTYQGIIVAVQGISFELQPSEISVILGSNGAGKSTTLKAIAGFSPGDRASISRGSVWFEGEKISGRRQDSIARRGVGLIPERDKIFREMTVQENLQCVVTRKGVSREDILAFVYELFPVLTERRRDIAGLLSGGQAQMLAIARSLVAGPKLLLPDEVSLGIAPALAETIIEALQRINRETGVTILMVEQIAGLTLEVASRAYVLAAGRIVFGGSTAELKSNSLLSDFYLGSSRT